MKIGIDIDNVISNFNEVLLNEFLNHDKKLRNTGIINNDVYITRGMFDWSKEELDEFYYNNIERIAKSLNVLENAPEYIRKLKEEGNEIYIISGRDNGEYSDPYKMTFDWLNKYNIVYDKLILTNAYNSLEKAKICLENDIDIMIDDSTRILIEVDNSGITALLMDTPYNRNENDLKRVHNWKEIYEFITSLKNKKVNVILDTDTYNECDDQFALSQLLKNQDIFNIEAITVAPYSHIDRFYNDGYHGIQERRVIWDISVVAYMINKKWFTSKKISLPNINDNTSYELTNDNHKIIMINYIDVDKIYNDLFKKLGEQI